MLIAQNTYQIGHGEPWCDMLNWTPGGVPWDSSGSSLVIEGWITELDAAPLFTVTGVLSAYGFVRADRLGNIWWEVTPLALTAPPGRVLRAITATGRIRHPDGRPEDFLSAFLYFRANPGF